MQPSPRGKIAQTYSAPIHRFKRIIVKIRRSHAEIYEEFPFYMFGFVSLITIDPHGIIYPVQCPKKSGITHFNVHCI